MKKILLSLFIIINFFIINEAKAEIKCEIKTFQVTQNDESPSKGKLLIEKESGSNCKPFKIKLIKNSNNDLNYNYYLDKGELISNNKLSFGENSDKLEIEFNTNYASCEYNEECTYYSVYEEQNEQGSYEVKINSKPGLVSSYFLNENLKRDYQIKMKCEDKDSCGGNFKTLSIKNSNNIISSSCRILTEDSRFGFSPYGDQRGKLIINQNGSPNIELFIPTENCSNKDYFNIIIEDTSSIDEEAESANTRGYHPNQDNISITYQIGEEDCDAISKGVGYCNYGMKIYINKQLAFKNTTNSDHTSKTKILFNCYKSCDTGDEKEWELLQTNLSKNSTTFSTQSTQQTISEDSGCLNSDGNHDSNCYDFLAQIDGLGEETINEQGDKVRVIKDLKNFKIGDYVNQLYTVGIGLLAVFAVVMMITSGVQYMTEGSIFGKSLAKERMTNAGLGLILALSIYLILNTINPELLDVNFGKFDAAKISIIDGPAELDDDGYYVNKKGEPYRVNGQKLKENGQWTPKGTETWKSIVNIDLENIFVNKPGDCSRIGQSCTSLYFSPEIYTKLKNKLIEIQKKCDCKFTITGGSEFWWHNTHSPYNATIDISINPQKGTTGSDIKKLNKTLTCGYTDNFKTAQSSGRFEYKSKSACLSGVLAYAEGGKQPHWHIDFE